MQARITVITLAVDDLERALRFYRDGSDCRRRASSARNSSMAPSPSSTCRRG